MFVFLNESLVPEHEAVVSVFDHGFLYGDGIYETMRAYDGVVFKIEDHLERLQRSASLIGIRIPDKEFINKAIYETLSANNLKDAYIRITVSRGKGQIGLDPDLCKIPSFIVIATEFIGYPEKYYSEGVRLIIARTRRNLIEAINPQIKSLNFLNNIFAKIEAKQRGGYEAIMLNSQGFIAEGTISNIFFIKEGVLCTPSIDVGVLDGITRRMVLVIAKENGIQVNEGKFTPEDIYRSSEVFFTNTTSEVMPVSQVEDKTYPVGEITKKLHELYRQEVWKYVRSKQ